MTSRSRACWVLAAGLLFFSSYVAWLKPINFFSRYHDDAIYFSSAQSLARGQGYRLLSVPGNPPQTKYPVLYPWLLSWIWRVEPSFPANLKWALAMTPLFGCGFLVASFLLLRRFKGVGEWPALFAVLLCAYDPVFLRLNAALLSEVPFMAFAMTAALAADHALENKNRTGWVGLATALAALSVLTRSIGVGVVAGLAAAALYRRAYRYAAVFCLGFFPVLLWRSTPVSPGEPGWVQTWLYYTSYLGFWMRSVPNLEVLQAMFWSNVRDLLVMPAEFCFFPPLGGERSYLGQLLSITLTFGIGAGIVRQARADRWRPIHFVFLFYAPFTLLWNYPIMNRFLMPFVPLFWAGVWVEGRRLVSMVAAHLRRGRPIAERIVAGVFTVALVAIGVLAVSNYLGGIRKGRRAEGEQWAAYTQEKRQAYDWIQRNTAPDTRLLALDDVVLYLYTGRQAMWPLAFTTASFFSSDVEILRSELDHLTDVARHIGARYWVTVEGDQNFPTGSPLVAERVLQLQNSLPQMFRSSGGTVRVRDLSPVLQSR